MLQLPAIVSDAIYHIQQLVYQPASRRTAVASTTLGFTIVELLIVIVVIGILAAITIVAFNGISGQAKDTERKAELSSIQKALERYRIDNGGYPTCASTPGTNLGTYTLTASTAQYCLADDLVPKYLSAIPADPTNTGSYRYHYGAGYKKMTAISYASTTPNAPSDNYILGVRLESATTSNYSGWGITDMNYLLGSAN